MMKQMMNVITDQIRRLRRQLDQMFEQQMRLALFDLGFVASGVRAFMALWVLQQGGSPAFSTASCGASACDGRHRYSCAQRQYDADRQNGF